jgi:UDP-GlcNAc:undecaprenyl-phosphate/decaprenyl-phosphate GlcNAc-1-phosphate transferase
MQQIYFLAAFIISLCITPIVRHTMRHFGIVDKPKTEERKIHKKQIPLGGGWAIFFSFFIVIALLVSRGSIGEDIPVRSLVGIFIASVFLMIGGILDDKYRLRPRYQILFPILACIVVIFFGIGIESISRPAGGVLSLVEYNITIAGLGKLAVFADVVVFFWLMGMMFTTKVLDGLDGLVTGIVAIGAILVYIVSKQPQWYQPEVGLVALVFAGACLGFLVWNFYPAKIFLGEGGSLFTGFMLGILAVISGSKIATTLLVMGVPILDVARVIFRRIQKKKSIFIGDSEHLHYRLLQSGLTQKQAVLLLYGISFLFGMTTLFLQSREKIIALSFLFVLMLLAGVWFSKKREV